MRNCILFKIKLRAWRLLEAILWLGAEMVLCVYGLVKMTKEVDYIEKYYNIHKQPIFNYLNQQVNNLIDFQYTEQ